jgi:hypothetical protein
MVWKFLHSIFKLCRGQMFPCVVTNLSAYSFRYEAFKFVDGRRLYYAMKAKFVFLEYTGYVIILENTRKVETPRVNV